jgi:putative nucleotidyltransferase with HDIG domain
MFNEARMGRTVDAEGCLPLVEEIASSVGRNPGAMVSLARLKTQDDYSYMHSVAVCALMVALARQLGLDEDACREAGLAGLMHDIGKAVMPLEVLNKPGKLTEAEFRSSAPPGARPCAAAGRPRRTPQTLDVVLHHHERIDGTGYPHRWPATKLHAARAHGRHLRRLRRHHLQPPLQGGLGPGRVDRAHGQWKGHFDPRCSAPSCAAWASTPRARWCGWNRAGWRWSPSRTRPAW